MSTTLFYRISQLLERTMLFCQPCCRRCSKKQMTRRKMQLLSGWSGAVKEGEVQWRMKEKECPIFLWANYPHISYVYKILHSNPRFASLKQTLNSFYISHKWLLLPPKKGLVMGMVSQLNWLKLIRKIWIGSLIYLSQNRTEPKQFIHV